MMFIPAPFWSGSAAAVDPCVVILLDHMDALPLVNEAPYPVDALTTNYAIDTAIKAFGTGSLKSTGTVGQQIVDYTGEPGGGIELTNGDMTVEFRFRRAGGSGTPTVDLWQYYMFIELDSGGWIQFTIFSQASGNQGFRIELQDGSNYDELIVNGQPLGDSDFHACAATIESDVARIFLDGTQIGSATLGYSAAGQRVTKIYYGDVVSDERVDETRVMVNRAAYTASYTPATEAFSTTDCGDTGTPAYYGDTILILNCEQSNGSTTFIDTSPIGHTVTAAGGISITDQFAVFDGTDDVLRLADATEWDFGTQDFTIEAVADLASLPALWSVITNRSPGVADPDEGFQIIGSSAGVLQGTVWGEPSGGAVVIANMVSAASTVTTGLHHICMQRSGSDFVLAYDGVSVATATSSAAMGYNSGFDVQVGTDDSAAGRFFNGSMRVRVTKGIARYTFPFTPSYDQWPDPT